MANALEGVRLVGAGEMDFFGRVASVSHSERRKECDVTTASLLGKAGVAWGFCDYFHPNRYGGNRGRWGVGGYEGGRVVGYEGEVGSVRVAGWLGV